MFRYILYRIGEFLSVSLPPKFGYKIAKTLSILHYYVSKADRIAVRGNIKAIFPEINEPLLKKYTKDVFINFGVYLENFLKFSKLDASYIEKNVIIEGIRYIDASLSLGKGLIIASAHIGNWELGAVALGLSGYSVNAVALPHNHKMVDAFFNGQREANNVSVIPIARAVRGCFEALAKNEIICLVGDRDFTQGGIVVDLFGKPTMVPRGPAVFSLRSKAPIVAGFTIRQDNDKFRLRFNPPIKFTPVGEYEKDVYSLTKLYLKQIEDCIRLYPGQWSMFRQFWL